MQGGDVHLGVKKSNDNIKFIIQEDFCCVSHYLKPYFPRSSLSLRINTYKDILSI